MFNVHISHNAQWCILQGKVHRLMPNNLNRCKVKQYPYGYYIYSPNAEFLSISFYDEPFLSMRQFWMTQNYLEISRLKVYTYNIHHWSAIFLRFTLYDELFLSHVPFSSKSTLNDPIKDLDMFKVKNTNMLATYTPEAQIFVHFALRWAVFELRPNFQEGELNDPKWPWHVQGQKYQQEYIKKAKVRPNSPVWATAAITKLRYIANFALVWEMGREY